MRILTLLALLVMAAGASFAQAQDARFSMRNTDDGFIKLDSKTGTITECRQNKKIWNCSVLNEENSEQNQTKLENERLKRDNSDLKAKVAELEGKLKKRVEKPTELRLPDDKDLDKMMGFFEKLMNKFMDLAKKTQTQTGEET